LQYVNANPPSVDNVNDGVIDWTNIGPLAVGSSTTIVANFIAVGVTPHVPGGKSTNVVIVTPVIPSGVSRTNQRPYITVQSAPTAVSLKRFEAHAVEDGVQVEWETAQEVNNLGYNVYRAESVDGTRVRVNSDLISGQGLSSVEQSYALHDGAAEAGRKYFYWLEDVDWNFVSTFHGPAVVYGESEPGSQPLAGFVTEKADRLYRISYETLKAAGVAIDGIDPATLQVCVGGREVAAFVTAFRGPMKAGDYILFYLAGEDGQAVEVRTGTEGLRMEEVYVAPSDELGAVWYGVAQYGMIQFIATTEWTHYLLAGFSGKAVCVLDVTDEVKPRLLYGYAWLTLPSETGLYLSYPTEKPARCIAVEQGNIQDVRSLRSP